LLFDKWYELEEVHERASIQLNTLEKEHNAKSFKLKLFTGKIDPALARALVDDIAVISEKRRRFSQIEMNLQALAKDILCKSERLV